MLTTWIRTGALALVLAGTFVLADSGLAQADECGHGYGAAGGGCGPRAVRRRGLVRGIYGDRGGCGGQYGGEYGSCAYVRRYATGGSWSTLRRYLTPTGAALRYVYVRHYFMRRYPHLFARHHYADAEPENGAEITYDHFLHPDYDVVANPLTETQQMRLGAWKFFLADYKGAREAFDAVLATAPEHRQARYGRMFCSVFSRDWKTAAADMEGVAELGDLRIDDEIADGIFGEDETLDRVIADVRATTRWSFGDGEAHLVSAWLHTTQGNLRLARVHAEKAERSIPDNTALQTIRAQLAGAEPESTDADANAESETGSESAPIRAPGREPVVASTEAKKEPVLVASR